MFFKKAEKGTQVSRLHKAHKASVFIDDLSLHEFKSSSFVSGFVSDHSGSLYIVISRQRQIPLASRVEYGICKVSMSNAHGIQVEFVHDMNEVSLDVLRELHPFRYKLIFSFNNVYRFSDRIWRLDERKESDACDGVSLNFPDRYEIPQVKVVSGTSKLVKRTVTYQRKVFRKFEGNSPQPMADPLMTYIAEGKYYILYGGMIPMKNAPQQIVDDLVDFLKSIRKFSNLPREEIRKSFEDCYYMSDAVWKYHILQERWELALADTNMHMWYYSWLCASRPISKIMKAFHHYTRKKVYYLCEKFDGKWGPLYEYDYQVNAFRVIALGYTFTKRHGIANGVIDFSNDTLLLLIDDADEVKCNILVFCFQTHKTILIRLKLKSNFHLLFKTIGFLDDYKKLVFFHPGAADWREKIAYVDWGVVKRKTLDHFLKKHRKIFEQCET